MYLLCDEILLSYTFGIYFICASTEEHVHLELMELSSINKVSLV
jgi:hypothetical protein